MGTDTGGRHLHRHMKHRQSLLRQRRITAAPQPTVPAIFAPFVFAADIVESAVIVPASILFAPVLVPTWGPPMVAPIPPCLRATTAVSWGALSMMEKIDDNDDILEDYFRIGPGASLWVSQNITLSAGPRRHNRAGPRARFHNEAHHVQQQVAAQVLFAQQPLAL